MTSDKPLEELTRDQLIARCQHLANILVGRQRLQQQQLDLVIQQAKADAWDEGYRQSELGWQHIYDGHPVPEGEMCGECSPINPYREGDQ